MSDFFFYGTLCHPPLLRAVLGREVDAVPARLPGFSVTWAEDTAFPMIESGGAGADGLYVPGLTKADVARLDFYEAGFAFVTRDVTVETARGAATARVYFPEPGHWRPGAPWRLSDWVAQWGEVAVATAGDFMGQFGIVPAERLRARYGMMLMRGGARVRAAREMPAFSLRRTPGEGDVAETRVAQVYANYFAVEEYDLRFRRFDGTMSREVNRGVFLCGDASVVLPYDPVRDRVLVIEQFRMGPHARGDLRPWLLEAPAGRVDGEETPETAARREAEEEAGLTLSALIPASNYYPSPAAMGEYLYTYIGIADLPGDAAGLGGLATEAEDIRAHVIPFARLMELVESGEVNTAPLIILAYWLERNRARLRAEAGVDAKG